jgi:hypothetical protein
MPEADKIGGIYACMYMHTYYSGFIKAARQDRQKGRGRGLFSRAVFYFFLYYSGIFIIAYWLSQLQ